ncbi:hypothetical protein [Poseidonocella sp. HB161398]|uniref:hypothetical protein n=1 Tax=Poseidonocella sp. HB161398 TaxID=2320855 RepID=UPI001107AB5C|nr:hypothetical protein [Poseidonocella sp. HB161398]
MTLLGDVLRELLKMFVADLRLTLATLAGVALAGAGLGTGLLPPLAGGAALVLLCLGVLAEAVLREARRRR